MLAVPNVVDGQSLALSRLGAPDGKMRFIGGWAAGVLQHQSGRQARSTKPGLAPGTMQPGALEPGQPGALKAGGDLGRESRIWEALFFIPVATIPMASLTLPFTVLEEADSPH